MEQNVEEAKFAGLLKLPLNTNRRFPLIADTIKPESPVLLIENAISNKITILSQKIL